MIPLFSCYQLTSAVKLHGDVRQLAEEKGLRGVELSISHTDGMAIAVAVASGGEVDMIKI
jgi:phosphopantetheinyl transferase (holo-ACP synthase)